MVDNGRWITVEAWCLKYSELENTIHKRVSSGAWARGEFYSAPDGGQGYINELRAANWLEQRGKLEL